MKHYIKRLLRESLINEDDDIKQSIISLLKSGDIDNIDLAYMQGANFNINPDELVKSIYGELLLKQAEGKTIKDKLLNLTNLERLELDNNNLTSLEGIENLTNLKWLDLSNNKLTSLEGIKNLTNLEVLKLSNNKLTSLKGIENLTNLEVLGLQNNPISGSEKARVKKIFGDKVEFFV